MYWTRIVGNKEGNPSRNMLKISTDLIYLAFIGTGTKTQKMWNSINADWIQPAATTTTRHTHLVSRIHKHTDSSWKIKSQISFLFSLSLLSGCLLFSLMRKQANMFEFINYISNIHESVVVYMVHIFFLSILFFALYLCLRAVSERFFLLLFSFVVFATVILCQFVHSFGW